jgi:hypothetical protein
MDIYGILCIFILISLCIWHGVMGFVIFLFTPNNLLTTSMLLTYIDQCAFMSTISIFILIHVVLLVWVYFVPLKQRREMAKKDFEYRRMIFQGKKNVKYIPITM